MAIAALILGILSILLFSWLGVAAGILWFTTVLQSQIDAKATIDIDIMMIWGPGIGVGVVIPAIPMALGIAGIVKRRRRGLSIAGLCTGFVGAVIGLGLTIYIAGKTEQFVALSAQGQGGMAIGADGQIQGALNDPSNQQSLMDRLQKRAEEYRPPRKPDK